MAQDLRTENAQLRKQLDEMRRERDSALIAGSLHVCDVDDREGTPAPAAGEATANTHDRQHNDNTGQEGDQ